MVAGDYCETLNHTCKRLPVGSASTEVAVRQELFGRLSFSQSAQAIRCQIKLAWYFNYCFVFLSLYSMYVCMRMYLLL